MNAILRKIHFESFSLIVIWIVFIFTPLLEKQYYILSQCIMQSLIILYLLLFLVKAVYSTAPLRIKFGIMDLFFLFLGIVFFFSAIAHENKYQGFLSVLDMIIFFLFAVAFRQAYSMLGELHIYLPIIFSGFFISIVRIFNKFILAKNLGMLNTNVLALYVFIAVMLSLRCARKYGFRSAYGIMFLAITGINCIALILTPSRSISLILIAIVLFFSIEFLRKNKLIQLAILILLLLSLAALIYQFTGIPYRFERISIWKASIRIFQDNIWNGVGPGNFQYYGYRYNFPTYESPARYGQSANHAHSQWLQIVCEAGLLSFIPLGFYFFYFMKYSFMLFKKKLITGTPFFISFAFFVFGFFNNFFDSYAAMFLFIAMLIDFQNYSGASTIQSEPGSHKTVIAAISIFLLITLILFVIIPYWAHFEYTRAIEYMKSGDEGKAAQSINSAINKIPVSSTYLRVRASLRIMEYNRTKALTVIPFIIRDFELAKAANALDFNTYLEEAQFNLLLSQQFKYYDLLYNAIIDYKIASSLNPYNPFYHYALANCYLVRSRYDEAEKELIFSVQLEPNYIAAHYLLSKVYQMTNNNEKALSFHTTAIELARKYKYYPVSGNQYLNALLFIPDELKYELQQLFPMNQ